ncbi:MAG: hypothetical protein JO071_04730 [Deltaproteobacteria bacterium]|nr:hypothetical protein [Deltaproteobacteria bacterium]
MSELLQTLRPGTPVMVADPITFRDYKLLLRSEHFIKPAHFHKFWKLTRHTAKAVGVDISKIGKPLETHLREVLFFDTPKFRLYNHGFILRRRMFYKKGLPQSNHELTLKFRHPDRHTAAAVDVRPLLPCTHTIKFKEETLMEREKLGSMRTIYSHGCDLDTPNVILTQNFESITQVFPALLQTGAKAKTLLSIVNGVAIEEILANCGEIDFGNKVTAKATLAIWRNRMTQEHLVGEYAYQIKFSSLNGFHGKPRELSEAFFMRLQEDAQDWLHIGTTKTAMVYGLGRTPVTNTE